MQPNFIKFQISLKYRIIIILINRSLGKIKVKATIINQIIIIAGINRNTKRIKLNSSIQNIFLRTIIKIFREHTLKIRITIRNNFKYRITLRQQGIIAIILKLLS